MSRGVGHSVRCHLRLWVLSAQESTPLPRPSPLLLILVNLSSWLGPEGVYIITDSAAGVARTHRQLLTRSSKEAAASAAGAAGNHRASVSACDGHIWQYDSGGGYDGPVVYKCERGAGY